MKIVFIRQPLALVFSFMLSLSSLVVAEHVHLPIAEEVDCDLCSHAGNDAALHVAQAYLPLTASQDIRVVSVRFPIYSRLIRKQPRGPPFFSA
jgi:hypothetical protein